MSNTKKNINQVVANLQRQLKDKRERYNDLSYVRAITTVADSLVPYKKSEFSNLPYVGEQLF
jgi:hypothetical protein